MTESRTARIVVGVDGSEGAHLALDWAYAEAALRHATLEVVHAWNFPYYGAIAPSAYVDPQLVKDAAQALLDQLVDEYTGRSDVVVSGRLVEGPAAAALCAEAKGADLLVVGSRGRGGFTGLLLGSVGQQVTHHAPCPVVVIPGGED